MNICRIRNWLANYSFLFIDLKSLENKELSEKETDIQSLIWWGLVSVFLTISFYWWMLPIYWVYSNVLRPVFTKKYKCDNILKGED